MTVDVDAPALRGDHELMRAVPRPPLLAAVGALEAHADASAVWIRAVGEPGGLSGEETEAAADTHRGEGRIDAVVIEFPGSVSSELLVENVERITESLTSPPEALWIALDQDVPGGGWWETLKRASGSPLAVASITEPLERTAYRPVAVFRSPDPLDRAHSFYAAGSGLYRPPRTAHPLRRLAGFFGTERFSYASAVIFANRAEVTGLPVERTVREWLPEHCRPDVEDDLELLGFRVRDRGTLLLFLESGSPADRFVAKISLREESDDQLRNSFHLQQWLTGCTTGMLRAAIPTPLSLVEGTPASGGTAYVESMERGVVAWKVNTGRRRSEIERAALEFLENLQEQTRRPRPCGEEVLDNLLHPGMARAETATAASGSLVQALRGTGRCIREFHLGKQVGFAASHGDFGIGNVLVDENSGSLTAVLDWADGRRFDFPSVDPFNWLIQQRRDREGFSFVEAVDALRSDAVRGSAQITDSFLVQGETLHDRRLAALQTAAFRYVERSLRYPWAFRSDCGHPAAVASMLDRLRDAFRGARHA